MMKKIVQFFKGTNRRVATPVSEQPRPKYNNDPALKDLHERLHKAHVGMRVSDEVVAMENADVTRQIERDMKERLFKELLNTEGAIEIRRYNHPESLTQTIEAHIIYLKQ